MCISLFHPFHRPRIAIGATALALLLAGCADRDGFFDWDLRSRRTVNTADAVRQASPSRPQADERGVISYPGYQVVVARRGDSVGTIAGRLGLDPVALGRVNAIQPDLPLMGGEVLVLPSRVAEPAANTGRLVGAQPPADIGTIATTAIDRAEAGRTIGTTAGAEPVRHRVQRGETAYIVARRYGVSPQALADWNGLGPDLALREGQTLLIPPLTGGTAAPTTSPAPAAADSTRPGQGSATPQPPSAARPLPAEKPTRAGTGAATDAPPPPSLPTTAASAGKLAMPADGAVIRPYQKGKYDGVGIGAAAGSPVRAAADGTVAAITRDTDQVPIIVLRHEGNLLTVYANVDGTTVQKDDRIKRGQQIGKVRAGNPPFLHFEVRRGTDSVDPMTMLQ